MTEQLAITHPLDAFVPHAFRLAEYVTDKNIGHFQTMLLLDWKARVEREFPPVYYGAVADLAGRREEKSDCKADIIRALSDQDYKLIDLSHRIGRRMSMVANCCATLMAEGKVDVRREGNTRRYTLIAGRDERGNTLTEDEAQVLAIFKDGRVRTIDDVAHRVQSHIAPSLHKILWRLRDRGFLKSEKVRDQTIYGLA